MNFDDAIATHTEWKTKLRAYIKKPDKSLIASVIEKDNECALGKWLYGEGSKFKSKEHFQELLQEHAEFHKCAANIVRQADLGKLAEAEILIDAKSKYTEHSLNVVTKIRKIRNIVEQ